MVMAELQSQLEVSSPCWPLCSLPAHPRCAAASEQALAACMWAAAQSGPDMWFPVGSISLLDTLLKVALSVSFSCSLQSRALLF